MPRPTTYDDTLRDNLLRLASETLVRGGETALSLRRLAADAQTSTSAVYALFGGKPQLVSAVMERAESSFTEAQEVALAGAESPLVAILAIGWAYRTWALANPDLYALMFGGAVSSANYVHAELPPSFQPLFTCVERLQQVGIFRTDEPAISIAASVWGCVHGVVSLEIAGRLSLTSASLNYGRHLQFIADGWSVART